MTHYRPVVAIVGNQKEEVEKIYSLLGAPRYRVWKLTSGEELLSLVRNERVDVVIMDYFLQDMKVPLSIEKIKGIDRNIRIIIMIEKPSEYLERSARMQGISFFAIKPNDLKYIRDAVRTAILSRQRQNYLIRKNEPQVA
ncbi:MAG: response regulator [Calditrichaeota bacterium]|nr:response regulator [Calditrichota bacterium]